MTVLGIVPARGRSKRLPRKNLIPLNGRPLIWWTITSALESGSLDRLVVSTDDPEIAEVARRAGAEVPFTRPPELATDTAASIDVIFHTLETLQESDGYAPSELMLLQPTSPLRTAVDIRSAISAYRDLGAEVLLSVELVDGGPLRITPDLRLLQSEPSEGSDDLPACALNGAIYLAAVNRLKRTRSWFGANTVAFIMPPERSLDIDLKSDLALAAEALGGEKN